MKIDITKLKNLFDDEVLVDEKIVFPLEDVKKTEMLELSPVLISGSISRYNDGYNVNLNVTGTMVLSCALTLKPVDYDFNINIDEIFSEDALEISKKIKNFENSIDILPIVWENILMEIPMRVVSPDASLDNTEGDGWKLITEDCGFVNPEFQKLKDLFNEKEV